MSLKKMNFYVVDGLREEIRNWLVATKEQKEEYKYCYVISKLCYALSTNRDGYENEGVPLNTGWLTKIFQHRAATTGKIIDDLVNWGVIIKVKNYCVGKYASCFKLAPVYEKAKLSYLSVTSKEAPFITNLLTKVSYESRYSEVVKKQLLLMNRLSINSTGLNYLLLKYPHLQDSIEQYRTGLPVLPNCISGIEAEDFILMTFLVKDFFVKRPDPQSRIFSNLTCLKREYRHLISMDGRPLMITDITNAQILFSVIVIEDYFLSKTVTLEHLPEDFERYKELAEKGQVYEAIAAGAGMQKEIEQDRKKFKQDFFKDIFFSKVGKPSFIRSTGKYRRPRKSKIAKAFESLFPEVARAIEGIKANNYADFAIKLQKMESSIMIDKVLAELYAIGLDAFSLHDAILTNDIVILGKAKGLIAEVLRNEYDLQLKLSYECLCEDDFIAPVKVIHPNIQLYSDITGLPADMVKNVVKFDGFKVYLKESVVIYNNSNKKYSIKLPDMFKS